MASTLTISSPAFSIINSSCRPPPITCTSASPYLPRRSALVLVAGGLLSSAAPPPASSAEIGLFGIRKKQLEEIEEEALKVERQVEKAVGAAEGELKAAEEQVVEMAAEEENLLFNGKGGSLYQAGAVVGAEILGVTLATSIVNGILTTDTN